MHKTTITIIVYILGLVLGALIIGIWDANTNLLKAGMGLAWTAIFLVALFYADKHVPK